MRVSVHLLKYECARVRIIHDESSQDLLMLMNVGFFHTIIIQFDNTFTNRQAIVVAGQFNVRRQKLHLALKKSFSDIF